jgi:hypothetical protein
MRTNYALDSRLLQAQALPLDFSAAQNKATVFATP